MTLTSKEFGFSFWFYLEFSMSEQKIMWKKIKFGWDVMLSWLPYCYSNSWASQVALGIKNPQAMQKTEVWSLSQEDPLEEGMATHSSILAWRIPMDRGVWQVTICRVAMSWTWLKRLRTHAHMQTPIYILLKQLEKKFPCRTHTSY